MGADLFESYVGSMVATMALAGTALALFAGSGPFADLAYTHNIFVTPILIAAIASLPRSSDHFSSALVSKPIKVAYCGRSVPEYLAPQDWYCSVVA